MNTDLDISAAIAAEKKILSTKMDRGRVIPDPYFGVQEWVIALVLKNPAQSRYLYSLQGVISAFFGATSRIELAYMGAQDAIDNLKKKIPFSPEYIKLIINQLSLVMPHGLTVAKLIEEGLNSPVEDD